jgi:hypothetical protein
MGDAIDRITPIAFFGHMIKLKKGARLLAAQAATWKG